MTTLLGEGHRLGVIDRVRAKGGTLMGNGPTATRKLLAKKVQRMVEIQHNDTWCYEGNLDSPLGYASSRMDFGNWTRAMPSRCMPQLPLPVTFTSSSRYSKFTVPRSRTRASSSPCE